MNVYDFTVKDNQGKDVSLKDYEGKVLLIVNTATECGFTPQYSWLQKLFKKYEGRGFMILDFPCNQFGQQAPGTAEEIAQFCQGRFGVTFPQFAKIDVNGGGEAPLYKYLKSQKGFAGFLLWKPMAHRIPAIATEVGGTPEIVIDGTNGVLLSSDFSNEQLVNAIKKIIFRCET